MRRPRTASSRPRTPSRRAVILAAVAFAASLAGPGAGSAQEASAPPAVELVPMVAGGLIGSAAGVFGGAFLGGNLENRYFPCHCDDPGLAGAFFGAVAGSTTLTPVLVHAMNGGRGSLRQGIAATVGVTALAVLTAAATEPEAMLAVPVLQVITAVVVERATSRRPARR